VIGAVVTRAALALALALAGMAAACAPSERGPIDAPAGDVDVALDLTQLALVDDGPFVDDEGPAIVPCGAGGVIVEDEQVEVRTEWCDPADLALLLPVDLPAGTLVVVELAHAALFADGGDVHLAVALEEEVVWQSAQTLPVPPAYVHERVPLVRDHFAGERVVVHVHNHGSNAYTLRGLRFTTP
jgi:hypothetical protein